jgi:murein peptide amidase A
VLRALSLLLAAAAAGSGSSSAAAPPDTRQLGRSWEGRAIEVVRAGDRSDSQRVLVVGCIHGDECAGMAVTRRLARLGSEAGADLWLLHNLNPDGLARRTRANARGADLNRDFDTFSQRESRIARTLILRLRPDVTIWFHQPQAVIRAWGGSRAAARRYARIARQPYRSLAWPPGAATRWQNGLGQVAFVVELPPGPLASDSARRHVEAVLRLAER